MRYLLLVMLFATPASALDVVVTQPSVDIQRPASVSSDPDPQTDAFRAAEAQTLRGRQWVLWAIQWNKSQYERAQLEVQVETHYGSRVVRRSDGTVIAPTVYRRTYGHGPVMLYNPFVEPTK